MPLNNAIPQIDDRRYDSLLAEVRTRIARYTPEWTPVWTDVNDSDPGITMVQVFAWLAEILTYRMSKVPELNYVKFLQLLGIELNPAEPAQAEITFPVKPDHPEPFVIVPARTQVTAEAPDGGPPLVFETERALTALTASLASVQAFDGYTYHGRHAATTRKRRRDFNRLGRWRTTTVRCCWALRMTTVLAGRIPTGRSQSGCVGLAR